jgi:hypothetical protein
MFAFVGCKRPHSPHQVYRRLPQAPHREFALSGHNLSLNTVSFEMHNFIKCSPYSSTKDDQQHKFTLALRLVQTDMRDFTFYYGKKDMFRDSGMADIILGGQLVGRV